MPPHMIAIVAHLTTSHHVQYLQISVPLVTCLLDGVRYFRPGEVPAIVGQDAAVKPKPPPDKPQRRWR
jgi:hypothetical protein